MASPASADRQRWNLLATAMGGTVVLYGAVGLLLASRSPAAVPAPDGGSLRALLLGAAALCLLGSHLIVPRVPPGSPRSALPPPFVFFRRGLGGMALAETAALAGLVLFLRGRSLPDLAILVGLSLAALASIAARGRAYWDSIERPEDPDAPVSPG